MTLFEYLAIAFSLLYSLAALRLLGGLPAALAPGRRYSLHLGLSVILLLWVAISFWTFWSLRDVEWTFPGFLIALAVPGLSVAEPNESPQQAMRVLDEFMRAFNARDEKAWTATLHFEWA